MHRLVLTFSLLLLLGIVASHARAERPSANGVLSKFRNSILDTEYQTVKGPVVNARVELFGDSGRYNVMTRSGATVGRLQNVVYDESFVDQYGQHVPAIHGDWRLQGSTGYFVFRAPGGDDVLDGYWGEYEHRGGKRVRKGPVLGSWDGRIERLVSAKIDIAQRSLEAPEERLPDERPAQVIEVTRPEQVIGNNNILKTSYLRKGLQRSESVGRMVFTRHYAHSDPERGPLEYHAGDGYGTCFVVGEGLVMTANHVVKRPELLSSLAIQFDERRYENEEGVRFVIEGEPIARSTAPERPGAAGLDYALLRIQARDDGHVLPPPIRLRQGNSAILGQAVTVIHHPLGNTYKHITLHNSWITQKQDRLIRYSADTLSGSSGAPVFNSGWEIIALHHGEVLGVTQESVPLSDDERYVSRQHNVGFSIDAILEDLKRQLSSRNDGEVYLQALGI